MIGLWLDLGYLQEYYLESSQTTCELSQPGVESRQVSRVKSTTSGVIRAVPWRCEVSWNYHLSFMKLAP